MLEFILHAGISFLLMVWFMTIYQMRFDRVVVLQPVLLTLLIGISKELYDLHSYGLFSWSDIEHDLFGIMLFLSLMLILSTRRT